MGVEYSRPLGSSLTIREPCAQKVSQKMLVCYVTVMASWKLRVAGLEAFYLPSREARLCTCQIGKFENCAGDFQTGVKMAQIVSKFESTMRISVQ